MFADWLAIPSAVSATLFLLGWCAGWLCFIRTKSLPHTGPSSASTTARGSVSVIIPCRNEASNLLQLLPNLRSLLLSTDEIIVVDDDSDDDTAEVAQRHGVTVVAAGPLPRGWAGKSHACWQGAQLATNEVLLFIDADVRVKNRAIDDLVAEHHRHPHAVVSAMPWHRTVGTVETLSMLFNVVSALVASVGTEVQRRVAYGPFLAVNKKLYMRVGGHSHESVRSAVVEDLALARVMPSAVAMVADRHQVEYRMYPLGIAQLVEGWTKNTAIGAVQVPRASAVLIIAWIISLCGGPFTSVWCYMLTVGQLAVMARRFGKFGIVSALMYPLHTTVFVAVALRSVLRSALLGRVDWRGRSVATR